MKFAKGVFWSAGTWGVLVMTAFYFMFDRVGSQYPPSITHPEFYYGFAGITLAWQFAFLMIATDPARYRLMIIPSVIEKFGYVGTLLVLYLQGRLNPGQLLFSGTDLTLGVLFVIAFFKTRPDLGLEAGELTHIRR